LLKGTKKRAGVSGRREAEWQKQGRGWGISAGTELQQPERRCRGCGRWGSGCKGNRWEERQMGD